MRYRSSHNGGRPFAKPHLLDKDVRGGKAKATLPKLSQTEAKRRTLQVLVNVQDILSGGREIVAKQITEAINKAVAGDFKPQSSQGDLLPG